MSRRRVAVPITCDAATHSSEETRFRVVNFDDAAVAVGGYLLPDDSVRVNKAPEFYDRVLAANPQITHHTVQVAAEAIAGPICQQHRVAGVRWDDVKGSSSSPREATQRSSRIGGPEVSGRPLLDKRPARRAESTAWQQSQRPRSSRRGTDTTEQPYLRQSNVVSPGDSTAHSRPYGPNLRRPRSARRQPPRRRTPEGLAANVRSWLTRCHRRD